MKSFCASIIYIGIGIIGSFIGCTEAAPPTADPLQTFIVDGGGDPGQFKAFDGTAWGASACQQGTIDKLRLKACSFVDEKAAAQAAHLLDEAVDEALTVVVQVKGPIVFVLSDADRVDPKGKAIVSLLQKLSPPQELSPLPGQ